MIFDWEGQGKEAFVTNEKGYLFYAFPPLPDRGYKEYKYKLYLYHPKIWKNALEHLSTKRYSYLLGLKLANRESVAKCLAGTR